MTAMDTPDRESSAKTGLRAPTRPRNEADAWHILGVSVHPSGSSATSIDGIRAQALAHAARLLAGWLLPKEESVAHLVMFDLHVWESSEIPELWSIFMRSNIGRFSESQGAWELRLCGAEQGILGAAIALVMMFGWGIAGRDGASARHLGLDHDGIVRLWGGTDEDRSAIERALSSARES